MKKLVASALVAAAIPALWVSPAGAAVPKTKPTQTIPCPAGQEGEARVWVRSTKKGRLTKLAIDNPCAWHLGFSAGGTAMLVAPGAHFHWGQSRIAKARKAGLPVIPGGEGWFTDIINCSGGDTMSVIYRYDDVQFAC